MTCMHAGTWGHDVGPARSIGLWRCGEAKRAMTREMGHLGFWVFGPKSGLGSRGPKTKIKGECK